MSLRPRSVRLPVPLALLGALAIAVSLSPRPSAAAVRVPTGFVNDTLATGLSEPNSLAMLPDGRVLFTEQRTARVRMVVNGHVAATDPVLTVPSVSSTGTESGLQGITVHPSFPDSPYVFLFHNRTGGFLRLVRYRASGDLGDPAGENLTLSNPLLIIDDIPDETPNHNAGCLRFGPDGMLYVSLGEDDIYPCAAADLTSLRGQILRLRVDQLPPGGGGPVARSLITPANNPFVGNANANARLVYAYGMRNPWRYQIDRVTGTLYGCDVGETDFEEENEIHAGDFLGWPWREANLTLVRAECPEPGGPGAMPYVHPIAYFARDFNGHAITSAGMYRPAIGGNHNWPAAYYPDRGDVFYTDYYIGKLYRITWNGSSWVPAAAAPGQPEPGVWGTGFLTASDFIVGVDGSLWWLAQYDQSFGSSSGALYRVRYTDTTGVPGPDQRFPAMRAAPNPSSGLVEIAFELPQAAPVTLAIYDLSGRLRRQLFEGEGTAGVNRLPWNGLDDEGRKVPAGLYFAKLRRAGRPVATTRVLRVK